MEILALIKETLRLGQEECGLFVLEGIVPANQVSGDKQDCDWGIFDHEFVDQSGYDDDFWGFTFFPLPDGEYLKFRFHC